MSWDQWLAVLLALALLAVWVVMPVYSDEVATKFSTSNFFNQYGRYVGLFPQCQNSAQGFIPWIFYPSSIVMSMVYGFVDVLALKLLGIVFGASFLAMLAVLMRSRANSNWINAYFALVPFVFLGVVPLTLFMSRPEQLLVLSMLISTWLILRDGVDDGGVKKLLSIASLFFLITLAFYVHPKSIFYVPFFISVAFFSIKNCGRLAAMTLVIGVVLATFSAFDFNGKLMACADAPFIRKIFLNNTLLPEQFLSNPWGFMEAALNNLREFDSRLIHHGLFFEVHQSGWLPPLNLDSAFIFLLNDLISFFLIVFLLISNTVPLVLFVYKSLKSRVDPALWLAVSLCVGGWLNASIFNVQNFYSLAQYFPISLLIVALIYSDALRFNVTPVFRVLIFKPQLALALVSVLVFIALYAQSAYHFDRYSKSSIPGQELSIPVIRSKDHFNSIADLAETCDLRVGSPQPMVVDHMSYYVFKNSSYPIHVLYVSEFGYGGDMQGNQLIDFLKDRKVAGAVARCSWIPSVLKPWQKSNEKGYCCVNLDVVNK